MITQKPFYYLRHGQTDWNLVRRFQGQTDIPLNATGVEQAHAAKTLLKGLGISQIYCSPLCRARATADIVNETLNLEITEIRDLQECSFGVLEGEIRSMTDFSAMWRDGDTPEKAETYQTFTTRVFAAMNEALEAEGTPLIVAHGAVFWPIEAHMGLDELGSDSLPNAHPVRLLPSTEKAGWSMSLL